MSDDSAVPAKVILTDNCQIDALKVENLKLKLDNREISKTGLNCHTPYVVIMINIRLSMIIF